MWWGKCNQGSIASVWTLPSPLAFSSHRFIPRVGRLELMEFFLWYAGQKDGLLESLNSNLLLTIKVDL